METDPNSSKEPLVDKPLTKPESTARRIKKMICGCIPVYEDDEAGVETAARRSSARPRHYKINDYEANKVYLIGKEAERTFVLFSHVNIDYKIASQEKNCPEGVDEDMWEQRDFYFSKFDTGIACGGYEWWNGVIPETIMDEITKAKYATIIDAYPGPATVHLAKHSKIITCEQNPFKTEQILNNAKLYGVDKNI
jgi:hypothetical protein